MDISHFTVKLSGHPDYRSTEAEMPQKTRCVASAFEKVFVYPALTDGMTGRTS